jgi:hypothetical protein
MSTLPAGTLGLAYSCCAGYPVERNRRRPSASRRQAIRSDPSCGATGETMVSAVTGCPLLSRGSIFARSAIAEFHDGRRFFHYFLCCHILIPPIRRRRNEHEIRRAVWHSRVSTTIARHEHSRSLSDRVHCPVLPLVSIATSVSVWVSAARIPRPSGSQPRLEAGMADDWKQRTATCASSGLPWNPARAFLIPKEPIVVADNGLFIATLLRASLVGESRCAKPSPRIVRRQHEHTQRS